MSFFGSFFGGPKEKPDYSAELEKVRKDYDELKGLMDEWKNLPVLEACQKRLDALNKEKYHPITLLFVAHPVKDFYTAVDFFIKQLELAIQGDVKAINYIEDTRNEKLLNMLNIYKKRLENKIREVVEKSKDVVDWSAVKNRILGDMHSQKHVLDVYIPKEGEEKNKRKWFTEERLKALKNSSMSLPGRLVWTVGRGDDYINRYLNLLDLIIAADEEQRKKLLVDLKNLENDVEIFLTKEFLRIKNKYANILSGQGGI